MKHLVLGSASRAEDAGYVAVADIASITDELDVDYRLVGGHMTTLLVAAYGVTGVPGRETADADLAAEPAVVAHPDLPRLLADLDYRPAGASNRFARQIADGQDAVIDVLAPSPDGRLHSNRRHGDLYLDEIPGLLLALARPPVTLRLEVELQAGGTINVLLRLPDPLSALALKGLAYTSRRAEKDAVDVWRLLAVCHASGIGPDDWGTGSGIRGDAANVLRRDFGDLASPGLRAITGDRSVHTQVRALIQAVIGSA
jgi:hypothetical protein